MDWHLEMAERQKNQVCLASDTDSKAEGPASVDRGTEARSAAPLRFGPCMEEVVQKKNLWKALKRIQANGHESGVDGMTIRQLPGFLCEHWSRIRKELLAGTYRPQPLRRAGGSRRGSFRIPTILDRFVQQAILQVLQPHWDPAFSEHSYGFRPGRSAHQAVAKAQGYIQAGFTWVLDLGLSMDPPCLGETCFDRVNSDLLMGRVAKRVSDKRILKLIRSYLETGVMENGPIHFREACALQGGPLTAILSNLLLDDLDRELERRGHCFVRYADDCRVYVRSERAGLRLLEGLKVFLGHKLKLKLNASRCLVARSPERAFLGFCFTGGRCIAPEVIHRFKKQVRDLTRRSCRASLEQKAGELDRYLTGWRGYFGFCETPDVLRNLEGWAQWRLRRFVRKRCRAR